MPAKSDPRPERSDVPRATYYYRRSLSARELLPAIGIGVAAGLLAFYVTQVFLQRTPLSPAGQATRKTPLGERSRVARSRSRGG